MKRRTRAVSALLLAPGASASRDQSALVAIDEALTREGLRVERMDFPYRLAGRRAPDRQAVLVESVVAAARQLAEDLELPEDRIALGGRSMGGRMCSIAVAEGLAAAALVLVSYPLHPPGKPDKVRTGHFPEVKVPSLFLSGTRDTFGSPSGSRPLRPSSPLRSPTFTSTKATTAFADETAKWPPSSPPGCGRSRAEAPLTTDVRRGLPRPRRRGPRKPACDRSSPRPRKRAGRSPPDRHHSSTRNRSP